MSSTDLLVQMASLALKGQTVLITGASGGIGSSIATLFRRYNCHLVLTGTSQSKLDEFVKTLPDAEGKVLAYVCDIRDNKQVVEMVRKTVEEGLKVDVLINNAGFALNANAPFWEQDLNVVGTVMDVNVAGLMNVTHAVMSQHMMKRLPHPTGTIVNISSITGHQAPVKEAFETSYHTSKAAIEAFTHVLRHETVGTNLRILLNRPGTTRTEFHARRRMYDPQQTDDVYAGMGPLEAEDIAVGVLWQCLAPERVSVVLMETLCTSQRSLYVVDREWEKRNAGGGGGDAEEKKEEA